MLLSLMQLGFYSSLGILSKLMKVKYFMNVHLFGHIFFFFTADENRPEEISLVVKKFNWLMYEE